MFFRVIIPARWGSTRFPGKVLADLNGRSILARVYDVGLASGAATVTVATDDDRVAEHARAHGFDVAMTSIHHVSGTDRVAEVVARRGFPPDAVVVNLQGDAPLMDPATVSAVARGLLTSNADVSTASAPVVPGDDHDPNVVKVSTCPVAFARTPLAGARRHLGIYGYRVRALLRWTAAPPSPDELRLGLEQFRPLALGMTFRVMEVPGLDGPDINVPADLQAARLAKRRAPTHLKDRAAGSVSPSRGVPK